MAINEPRTRAPDDLILLYYTGHGVLTFHNDLYLAVHETTIESPEADGLEAAWLRSRLEQCRARSQVLILDCCHSGAFMVGRKDAAERAVTTETFGHGRYVLTASDAQSFAWDSSALKKGPGDTEGRTSLFTRLLVQALATGAAAPDKETITIHDLYTYVHQNLPADVPPMSPQIFVDRGAGDLVLARNTLRLGDLPGRGTGGPSQRGEPLAASRARTVGPDDSINPRQQGEGRIRRNMTAEGEPIKPISLFYSYSHEDEELCRKLKQQLAFLKRNGMITEWHDRDIKAGAEWETEINQHLSTADIILLLISASFIDSDYCWSVEVKKTLERHDRGEATVIPVILRPCQWETIHPLARLQATPKDATPVIMWSNLDAAFNDVANKIKAVVFELQGKRASSSVMDPAKPPPPESQPKSPVGTDHSPLGSIQFIHGWSTQEVQDLQQRMAQTLGLEVEFRDQLKDKNRSQGSMMVVIPDGRFQMGSPATEPGRKDDESQHEVEVNSFAIGKYTVTFEEYDRFTRATSGGKLSDEGWGRDRRPIINVNWFDAAAYAKWLSEQTAQHYRLPTEAEWEYACRAGTTTPFHFGDTINTDQANYNGYYERKTVEVGRFPANAWGLHDMHGNVWEWTCLIYRPDYNRNEERGVLRGGSWYSGPLRLRCAARVSRDPNNRSQDSGFRLVKTFS